MKSLITILLFFVYTTSFSQTGDLYQSFHLKKNYQDLSNMSTDSVAMIVKTLSINYGSKNLKSKDTLYFYKNNPQYNIYIDSLTLYYLMHVEKSVQQKENHFDNEVSPKTGTFEVNFNNMQEEMMYYEFNLRENLKHKNYVHVPVSYNSFDVLIKYDSTEKNYCHYYNNGRIRVYICSYDSHVGEVFFELAYHKTILPEGIEGMQMYESQCMPRKTHYKKPTIPYKESTNAKLIWEKQTGLPYEIALKLGLSDPMKQSKVLFRMNKVNSIKMKDLQEKPTDNLDERVTQVNYFFLKCDTCYLSYKDFQAEDNDVIKVYVNGKEVIQDTINLIKKDISFVNNGKEIVIYIEAISEGSMTPCTASMQIGSDFFQLALRQGRVCKIIIRKESE